MTRYTSSAAKKVRMNARKRRVFLIVLCVLLAAASPFLFDELKGFVKDLYGRHAPRATQYPASDTPDQICLTWSGDPTTTQTVQWRTSANVSGGVVQYRQRSATDAPPREIVAQCLALVDPLITNNPTVNRFTAVIAGLTPDTAYAYRVGCKQQEKWSEWLEFTTAPATARSFSFVYLGDVQLGFDVFAKHLRTASQRCPQAAFYLMAGDLANRGEKRDDWDNFFNAVTGAFDRKPLVVTIGNHDLADDAPRQLYLDQFALPENGPVGFPKERAYSLEYANATFFVLDSNLPPERQRSWLEQQLAAAKTTWKFALFHHPAYSSRTVRDNDEVREQWCDLFDKYHVDIAFQGHDHAYLRTPPIRAGKAVASPAEGTIYLIAVAGNKFYKQDQKDLVAAGFPDVSTVQTIDIQVGQNDDTLVYKAYDETGNIRDEFTITKPRP